MANRPLASGCHRREKRHSFVEVVEETWRRSHFLLQLDEHPLLAEDIRDLAVRIEDVAEFSRPDRAGFEARRVLPGPRPLNAEVTFLHHALFARAVPEVSHLGVEPFLRHPGLGEIEAPRPVGTRRLTVAAADAPVV